MAFEAVIDLATLDGAPGIRIDGKDPLDHSGGAVAAGDLNGDGIQDLIIGASGSPHNGVYAGTVYVVFGVAGGWSATPDLGALDGANGFRLDGALWDHLGYSIGAVGDINGDGIDDLAVGTSWPSTVDADSVGATYIVFGTRDGFPARFTPDDLDGTNGFRIGASKNYERIGYDAGAVGDINGDGFEDLFIGSRANYGLRGYYTGASFVVFGTDAGFPADLDVADLDGTNGFRIDGAAYNSLAGTAVAAAGDVNGDGLADLILGAYSLDANGVQNTGGAYVVFGSGAGFGARVDLAGVDGSNGFRISGAVAHEGMGRAVASAGDINGDGFADVIVGAQRAGGSSYQGAAYVVFGKGAGFAADIDVDDLDGTNGFRIGGEEVNDQLGIGVGAAGDVNGDGLDDLIVGAVAAGAGQIYKGASYVVFGRVGGFAADLDLASLDGSNGFKMVGEPGDLAGAAVGAGDLNDDGLSDLIIGAPYRGGPDAIGATYVVFGRAQVFALTGGGGDDALRGGMLADHLVGLGGRDRLEGRQGDDLLEGGDMGDSLLGGDGADDLAGGAGGDVLYGEAGDDTLDGGEAGDKLFGGAGVDTLVGGLGADRLDGGEGVDVLTGDADNDLLDGGAGADAMSGGTGNDVYLVDGAGDTTLEAAGEGFDIVRTALDGWVLGANIEALELQGSGAIDGTGNGGANNIQGNAGTNRLDGGAGVDTLNGNDGDDTVVGGEGSDLLRGGLGADVFLVAHAFGATLETDQVYDFSAAEGDIIDLSGAWAGTLALVSAFTRHAGEMTLTFAGGVTTLRLDVTGDGKVDYQMKLNGDVTGESGDWLL